MRSVPDLTVFSRSDARALGWTDSSLTRALRRGELVQVRRGQFTVPARAGDRAEAIAAARGCRGAVISHRSALLMHGLPIVGARCAAPEITVAPNGRGTAHAARLHRATLPGADVVQIDGVAVTSAARSVIDVARSRPIFTSVPAIDAALQTSSVTPAQLDEVVLRCWNWPGIRRALRAVRLSQGQAESPLESISRVVMHWLRVPPPQPQAVVLDHRGRFAGRLDFYWDEFGVAGEADGRVKYAQGGDDPLAILIKEKERQENLENLGMVVVRWGWDVAARRPQELRSRLELGFERGRARDRSGFPRQWSISPPEPGIRGENVIDTARQEGNSGQLLRAGPPRASP